MIRRLSLILLLLVGLGPLNAQDAADETVPTLPAIAETTSTPQTFSVDDAIAAALSNHPRLQAGRARTNQQQHLVRQVTRSPNPVVGYMGSEIGNDGELGQQGLFVSQEVIRGGKLGLRGEVQRFAVRQQTVENELLGLQIEATTRLAFVEAAYAQERLKLLQRLQKPLDDSIKTVERLLESGELSASAALQARLEARRNSMRVQETKAALQIRRDQLAAIPGWKSLPDDVRLQVDLLKPTSPETDEALEWNKILNGHPQLNLLQLQQSQAMWKVKRESAEPIPNLQSQWSLQQDASTNYTVFGVQLGWELPIRNGNVGSINAAHAEASAAGFDMAAQERSLRQRYVTIAGQRNQAWQQLSIIDDELEPLARRNLSTTREAFRLGEATYLDLLNAQRAWISLSLETLTWFRQLAEAKSHLETRLVLAKRR